MHPSIEGKLKTANDLVDAIRMCEPSLNVVQGGKFAQGEEFTREIAKAFPAHAVVGADTELSSGKY